jgi:calcineurin-like phosphoesterase
VIGVITEIAVEQMRTGIPIRFRTAAGGVRLEGVLVECGEGGRATGCELVRVEFE